MKRVHNDPGPPKSNISGSPPPSPVPTRGKKRKTGPERPESPSVEKELKRVATPPIVVRQQSQEPSLIERYHQSKQKLLETVKKLHDPRNNNTMDLFRNANDCLKVMAHTTKLINDDPSMGELD